MRDYNQGIFIDIFPLDYVDINFQSSIKFKILDKVIKLQRFYYKNNDYVSKKYKFMNKAMKKYIPNRFILKSKIFANNIMANTSKNSDYLAHLSNGVNKDRFNKFLIKTTDFDNTTNIVFENIDVPAPKIYNEYLKQIYGDYMKLPPIEMRKPHHNIIKIKT